MVVFTFLYLLWGTRTRTCCVFVYLFFLGNPLGVVILCTVGKVFMRFQHRWNRRKLFRSGGEIPRTSLANVDLRGGIDSRSLSRPLGGLNCDVRLPEMFP